MIILKKYEHFFLKSKDQVLDLFKYFYASIKSEIGGQLKYIWADNSGEYKGPYEKYCRDHGIMLEKLFSKISQNNKVVGRMNRTINKRIRYISLKLNCLNPFRMK